MVASTMGIVKSIQKVKAGGVDKVGIFPGELLTTCKFETANDVDHTAVLFV